MNKLTAAQKYGVLLHAWEYLDKWSFKPGICIAIKKQLLLMGIKDAELADIIVEFELNLVKPKRVGLCNFWFTPKEREQQINRLISYWSYKAKREESETSILTKLINLFK